MAKPAFSTGVFFDLISIEKSKWELELSFIKSLEKAGKPGHIEVLLEYPYSNSKLNKRHVRWLRSAFEGYDVLVHAPFSNMTLMATNEHIRNASIKEYKASIDAARAIRAKLLTFHLGHASFFADRNDVDNEKILKKSVSQLIGYAKKKGIRLAIENLVSPHSFPISIEQTRKVLNMFPELGLTVDVGHYYANRVNPLKAIINFLPRIENIHLHDTVKDKKELKDHQELGTGFINTKSIIRTLIKNRYKKYLTIETIEKEKIRRSYLMVKNIIKYC